MMDDDRRGFPLWLAGILLGLALIALTSRGGVGNPALTQRFVPRPTDPSAPAAGSIQLPRVDLPSLPPNIQRSLTDLRERFAGGEPIPALTPVASGARVRIEVREVDRNGDEVRVAGDVTNIGDQPLAIPPGAFNFRDSDGVLYTTSGSGGATLQPGQSIPFDLAVPLLPDRGLALVFILPPDPPLEQLLVVATEGG